MERREGRRLGTGVRVTVLGDSEARAPVSFIVAPEAGTINSPILQTRRLGHRELVAEPSSHSLTASCSKCSNHSRSPQWEEASGIPGVGQCPT